MSWSLDLFFISKSVDMCFAMLKQFSKPEFLNSVRDYVHSLTHFFAVSMCTLFFYNNSLTAYTPSVLAVSVPAWPELVFVQMPQSGSRFWWAPTCGSQWCHPQKPSFLSWWWPLLQWLLLLHCCCHHCCQCGPRSLPSSRGQVDMILLYG